MKPIYKAVRSVILVAIMLVAVIYVALYVLLSLPSVQNRVRTVACEELSDLLGGTLDIDRLSVSPFSEVLLDDVSLQSPQGDTVAFIDKVAAGIDLGYLIFDRRIVLNYAEIIGLDARISQPEKEAPLNIQFLIDALSPKDKTKPPTRFDLRFRNIVIRSSRASMSRPWMTADDGSPLPFSSIELSNWRLDLSIPTLKNDLFRFDIRNMQCEVSPGAELRGLRAEITYKKQGDKAGDRLSVRNLSIDLPQSSLSFGDVALELGSDKPITALIDGFLTPADLKTLVPALNTLDTRWDIGLDATLSRHSISVASLRLDNDYSNSYLRLKGSADSISSKEHFSLQIDELKTFMTTGAISRILDAVPGIAAKPRDILINIGDVSAEITGRLTDSDHASASGTVQTSIGNVEFDAEAASLKTKKPAIMTQLDAADLNLGLLLGNDKLGSTTLSLKADVKGLDKNAEGEADLMADYMEINGRRFSGLHTSVRKTGNDIHATVDSDDDDVQLELEADCHIDGSNSTLDAYLDLAGINTDLLGIKGKFANSAVGFNLDVHTLGDNADNVIGFLHLSDLNLVNRDGRSLHLDNLSVNIDTIPDYACTLHDFAPRRVSLTSDWLDADIAGHIHPVSIANEFKDMISAVIPALVPPANELQAEQETMNDFTFDFEIKGTTDLYDYLATPVCPLTEIPVKGYLDTNSGKFEMSLSTPHIRQGRNKLIRDTSLKISLDSFLGMAKVAATTIFPAKKGDVELALNVAGVHDKLNANLQLNPTMKSSLKGGVGFDVAFSRIPSPLSDKEDLSVHVDIIPSAISIKETVWNIANGKIDYFGKNVAVNNFIIEHGNQYVKINGVASEDEDDFLKVKLNDIDLDYIFSILNINYVTFGGMATGEVVGSRLLTKTPSAHTKFLRVKGLSYNGAVLGNGNLAASYFPEQQKVGIYAVINDPLTRERRASIDGGIWVTRDSLSFDFDANKVNLQLMKPFVAAFCSDLRGLGSGKCKLYGTFSDIDLIGKLRADTISMKIDFTNTWYHAGGDSVNMGKGLIEVKPLTLYDSEGHTARLSGWLRHRYFHEPEFNFKIRDAKSILCYDTNEKMNPLWYGTIYGSGSGQIAGRPGIVEIDMNMATDENSRFYYVISDAEDTGAYSFLSFTDSKKEQLQALRADTIPEYLHQFMKKVNAEEAGSSNVVVSLKGSVTNDALLTLVMDPVAGDKITARGQGALQMDYNMAANDLRMIGTYVLDEGNYFFTLQDIIIKNFNIKQGSSIKFDGDPMNANLDIAATYRVNTNLTDLDQSFAHDKELNRTNVPVDAILLVKGPMTHPDIDFDIELPTLTSDVERKVKSIVSTNDMMSRQIIYLLALNRFYTQEYTGGTSNSGAEWSSMASSTISSQLSNILSNMTDLLAVSPSFRSDKGDFTDMEFDLALSSRLLNNRLLINGNFGYRDRQTSNTQFVGDFDIEYLLNKNGNLRLKAYNHFNDQNYYLRSALTTQGVGIVYRWDFDRLFKTGRKKSIFSGNNLFIDKEHSDSTSNSVLDVSPKESATPDSLIKN
ncbi:MAG: translocation/assembly module TamB domain-containing protein [Bacteroidales bacterium]|nr:translocation/assembly module TamB domain-containing protein [Bacteroidales bacterium]